MRRALVGGFVVVLALGVAGIGVAELGTGTPAQRPATAAEARAAATARAAALPPGDLGAEILRSTPLRARPGGRVIARLGRRTAFGGPQVLAVVARRGAWIGVLHHRMPNGRPGWIPLATARILREPWSVEIDLSAGRALVRRDGEVVDRFRVATGAAGTATPTGRFAVTDRLVTGPGSVYGCCILALSGRQTSLPRGWPGGDRIALHGTPDTRSVGRPVTHGCLRAAEPAMRRLMRRLPVGSRVTVRA